MGSWLCCCKGAKGNPEECAPLVNKSKQKYHVPESLLAKSILRSSPQRSEFLDPDLADLIDKLSSGDDDDPLDPVQEEKYERILKDIED